MWNWLKGWNEAANKKLLDAVFFGTDDAVTAQTVREALNEGANPNAAIEEEQSDPKGRHFMAQKPALWIACSGAMEKTAQELLKGVGKYKADPNLPCGWLDTSTPSPLLALCKNRRPNYNLIKTLLDAGANPKCKTRFGASVLHCLVWDQKLADSTVNPLKLFLDKGVDINGQDMYGNTPLHIAIYDYYRTLPYITALLKAGADPNIADKSGILACRNFYGDGDDPDGRQVARTLIKLLESHHADLAPPRKTEIDKVREPKYGSRPESNVFDMVVRSHNISMFQVLLERGYIPSESSVNDLLLNYESNSQCSQMFTTAALFGVDMLNRNTPRPMSMHAHNAKTDLAKKMREELHKAGTKVSQYPFEAIYAEHNGPFSAASFFKPETSVYLHSILAVDDDGAKKLFDEGGWENAPQERLLALMSLTAQARNFLIKRERVQELFPDAKVDWEQLAALSGNIRSALKHGPLKRGDYIDERGKAKPQLIAWWRQMKELHSPSCWQGGADDVLAINASLPAALHKQLNVDIADIRRNAKLAHAESVMAEYVTCNAASMERAP